MRTLGVVFCVLACIVVIASATADIRGVAPYEQQFYKVDPFKCRNEPSRAIPASRINDNYCDCSDGSDEPGTAACVNGIFYCENKGYKGVTIFSSQVNDGICDCCDGSDEYEGKVKCTDDCFQKGAELRKQQEEEKAKIEKGLETKKQWIAEATKTLSEKRESIDGLKAQVDKLKKVVEDLEGKLKELGGKEKEEVKEDDKDSKSNKEDDKDKREKKREDEKKRREERRTRGKDRMKSVERNNERKKERWTNRVGEMRDIQRKEKERREAEKKGFEEKEKAEQDVINERKKELDRIAQEKLQQETPATPETEAKEQEALRDLLQAEPKPPHVEEGETQQVEGERGGENENDGEGFEHHHRGEEHHQEEQKPQVEEETELLKTIREGKRKLEEELSQVRRDLSTAENDLKNTEDILKTDFGANGEFFNLHGKCFEYKTREYTYSMCPFGETKQAHTSLGRYEKWDPAYTAMSFTNGQQCWGGPKRSAKVTFLCGSDNELYDIQEPNKCEYSMKFNTPAACSATPLEFLEHAGGLPHF